MNTATDRIVVDGADPHFQDVIDSAPSGSTFVLYGTFVGTPVFCPNSGDTFIGAPGAVLKGAQPIPSFDAPRKRIA
jgi:hypothetical protein